MLTLAIVTLLTIYLTVWNFHNVSISDAWARLISTMDEDVKKEIAERVDTGVAALRKEVEELEARAKTHSTRLEVSAGKHTGVIEGARHKQLERLITLVG